MKLKRIIRMACSIISMLPMKSKGTRPLFVKLSGVRVINRKSVFIGRNVTFDTNNPHLITIGPKVYITHGCTILSHFLDTSKLKTTFTVGNVTLEENCFLGCNTVICSPVRIGKNSIVAAGSIVTKDIPDNELWGGVPAKFIKKLDFK